MSSPLQTNNEMPNFFDWKALLNYGVPALFAGVLIWFLVARVDGRLDKLTEGLQAHQLDMQYSVKANEDIKQQLYFTNFILQQICVNQARNEDQRTRCFPQR